MKVLNLSAAAAIAVMSCVGSEDQDILPSGEKFPFWNDVTTYSREWHVDARRGDDKAGDGSAARPFRTINRAAACVAAGQKVVIHAGTYRETIEALAHGGDGPGRMVAFESAGDGEVVVSGAAEWNAAFVPSSGYRQVFSENEQHLFSLDGATRTSSNVHARVWSGRFPRSMFRDGENPFAVPICPSLGWTPIVKAGDSPSPPSIIPFLSKRCPQFITHWLCRRGLLFCDGEMMREVLTPQELWAEPEAKEHMYWVGDDGREIHFRLRGDAAPDGRLFEATVREQGFAPEKRGLAFVRLSGIVFEKFGNGQMPPQRGAISVSWGHHWIVEDCTVRDVHTVGLDLGVQSHWVAWDGPRGFDIVRNCRFERCGVHGVCGVPGNGRAISHVLVEGCRFDGIGWLSSWPGNTESGGVKFHYADGCLIRRNVFANLRGGEAVWTDKWVCNNRIAYNAVVDSALSFAAFFVECALKANRVDHNAVVRCRRVVFQDREEKEGIRRSGGRGCLATETDHCHVDRNFFAELGGILFDAPGHPPGKGRRTSAGEYPLQIDNRFERNIVVNSGDTCDIVLPGERNASVQNVFSFPPSVAGKLRFEVFGRKGYASVGESPDEGSVLARTDTLSSEGTRLKVRISSSDGVQLIDYSGDLSIREDFDRLMGIVDSVGK